MSEGHGDEVDGSSAVPVARRKASPYARREDTPDEARDDTRRMVSADVRLLKLLEDERARIEANLPPKRWRSKQEYQDLAMLLGIEQLRSFEPVVDPLAARWSDIAAPDGGGD